MQPRRSQLACWPNSWQWLQLINFRLRATTCSWSRSSMLRRRPTGKLGPPSIWSPGYTRTAPMSLPAWKTVNIHKRVFLLLEVEIPNNFCPSRFSQVCSDLHFLVTYLSRFSQVCLDLRFWWKSKSEHTWKHLDTISVANLYTHLRKSELLCVSRFAIWRKWKSGHTRKNLDGQKIVEGFRLRMYSIIYNIHTYIIA